MNVLAMAVSDTMPVVLREAGTLMVGDVYWSNDRFVTVVQRRTRPSRDAFSGRTTYEFVMTYPSGIDGPQELSTSFMRSDQLVAVVTGEK
jgi:hypothetical protein